MVYFRKKIFKLFLIWSYTLIFLNTYVCLSKKAVAYNQINSETTFNYLLRPKIKNITFPNEIYALKKNSEFYFSLEDVINTLELNIKYDKSLKLAKGWFLREDWKIKIDLNTNLVVSKNKDYPLDQENYFIYEGDIFINKDNIEDWFDFVFHIDTAQQFLEIESTYPLPLIAKLSREKKSIPNFKNYGEPKLPRHPNEYQWLDINTANIRIGTRYRKSENASSPLFVNNTTTVEGQALKHSLYALSSSDNRNNITGVSLRLSKKSETPTLLGPLQARSYAIGDITLAELPLTGSSPQELGFRVTNNSFDNIQFLRTDINGNAIPGWDIELYRNNILLGSTLVTNEGFYEFQNIELFAGNNEFELFFYGPQGEMRTRKISAPVTAGLLAQQDAKYDLSISLAETNVYQKNNAYNDELKGSPKVVFKYNKVINNIIAYAGFTRRKIHNKQKVFFGYGLTSIVNNFLIDANSAIDSQANTATQINIRRDFLGWNTSLNGTFKSKNYITRESGISETLNVSSNIQKSFLLRDKSRISLLANASYKKNAENNDTIEGRIGVGYQKGQYNVSNNILIRKKLGQESVSNNIITNTFSTRANFGKYFFRSGLTYNIDPMANIEQYFIQANYYQSLKFSSDLRLDYKPQNDLIKVRLGMNYINNYFTTSPFVELNNQQELYAGVNLNFNLIDTPHSATPQMTNRKSIGSGLVSSFVYHDKNGNNTYDESDIPLQDVSVKSMNIKRNISTDSDGYALINNLPETRVTDIKIDNSTLPDPFMLSATEGSSVFPTSGGLIELDFPVHMSGEIDGTVFLEDKKGKIEPIRGAEILLYSIGAKSEKKKHVRASYDGFYVASRVKPGKYIMMVSNRTGKKYKASLPLPRLVEISYSGDIIYGSDFKLDQSKLQIPINVVYQYSPENEIIYGLKIRNKPQSKILSLLGELNNNTSDKLYDDLLEVKTLDSTEKIYKISSNDLKESYQRCQKIAENAIPCSLEIMIHEAL